MRPSSRAAPGSASNDAGAWRWLSCRGQRSSSWQEEPIQLCIPEPDASGDTAFVGNDGDVGWELEMDLGGVSTAEIEAVVVQQGPHDLEHSVDAAVPLVHALCGQRGSSEILIIGLVLPDRMLSELEMRHQLALAIDCAAEARPQRQHAFEALALDDAKPLHLGVVQHANWLAQAPLELCGQRKVMQVGGPEIRRGND